MSPPGPPAHVVGGRQGRAAAASGRSATPLRLTKQVARRMWAVGRDIALQYTQFDT